MWWLSSGEPTERGEVAVAQALDEARDAAFSLTTWRAYDRRPIALRIASRQCAHAQSCRGCFTGGPPLGIRARLE